MLEQKKLINDKDWDVLVILDACRYDYFEKVHSDYLAGDLKKVESEGTWTGSWLKRTFDGTWDDTVYVSGGPIVNSQNYEHLGFTPKDTFPNIVDAWDSERRENWNILKPEIISKEARVARMKNPEKKMIVHFMQPHGPYRLRMDDSDSSREITPADVLHDWKFCLKIFVMDCFVGIVGYPTARKIRDALAEMDLYQHEGHLHETKELYGCRGLQTFYLDNLIWVLKEVKKLVERLPDEKIVITADHGEFLGEEGNYGHNRYYEHSILLEIPWLRVEK